MKPVFNFALALAVAAVLPAAAYAKPDLTGVWAIAKYSPSLKTTAGAAPPLLPAAKAVYEQHLAAAAKGDKSYDETSICLPEGLPRLMVGKEPFEIMQRPRAVFFAHQNRLQHTAYFNETLPTDPDPFFLGFSVAKWDGDTLVIESSGFRDTTLLDDKGLPHSESLHLTERYRLAKGGKTMTVRTTIDDPKTFARPWTTTAAYIKKPASFEMPEEICAAKLETTRAKR